MWRIIDRFALVESSGGVLAGLLNATLARVAVAHMQRVAELVRDILDRVTAENGADEVRVSALSIITNLYVWHGHQLCLKVLNSFIEAPSANAEILGRMMFHLRPQMTHGSVNPTDPNADAVRRRVLGLMMQMVQSAKRELRELEINHAGLAVASWPEAEHERGKQLVTFLDIVAKEIYFGSGAYANREQGRRAGERDFNPEERKRFFQEASSILDELTELGLPSIAYNLLQTSGLRTSDGTATRVDAAFRASPVSDRFNNGAGCNRSTNARKNPVQRRRINPLECVDALLSEQMTQRDGDASIFVSGRGSLCDPQRKEVYLLITKAIA